MSIVCSLLCEFPSFALLWGVRQSPTGLRRMALAAGLRGSRCAKHRAGGLEDALGAPLPCWDQRAHKGSWEMGKGWERQASKLGNKLDSNRLQATLCNRTFKTSTVKRRMLNQEGSCYLQRLMMERRFRRVLIRANYLGSSGKSMTGIVV